MYKIEFSFYSKRNIKMGVWGCQSCSNDTTMDILHEYSKRINKYSQESANKCLAEEFDTRDYSTSLGLVIWFLQKGLKMESKYLQDCQLLITQELVTENNGWGNFHARKVCLLFEEEMIHSALENDGKSKKKYKEPLGDVLDMI